MLLDLSHVVVDGMTTYPGIPGPVVCDFLSREASRERYAPGTEFHIGRIDLVANTGTYVDSPFHRFADGADLSELPLERLADLPAVVVDAEDVATGAPAFEGLELEGRAVLVRTGWSRHWGTDAYFSGHPHLTADAAELLVARGATCVGIESMNIDGTDTGERPVHTTLLAAGIPIVEHLADLGGLPAAGARFSAVPVKVRGMGTFPVRAYAIV